MSTVTNRANTALATALSASAGGPQLSQQNLAANAKLIDSTLKLMNQSLNVAGKALEIAGKALNMADQMGKAQPNQGTNAPNGNTGCFPTEKPNGAESPPRNAGLKVDKDSGKITTPGGYTIEPMGQFEWKVTGPDKKETRVWGDPHVEESDGGKWDFKKDTEFVLGDGTRIDVSCKPYGNGATVTGQLDIINGDSHVSVTDIDKGKGKTGEVKTDGDAALFAFGSKDGGVNHVTMGKSTAEWNFEGREIIGSEKQGETLKTKTETNPVTPDYQTAFKPETKPTTNGNTGIVGNTGIKPTNGNTGIVGNGAVKGDDMMKSLQDRFNAVQKMFEAMKQTQSRGYNPFRKADDFGKYDRNQHLQGMKDSFKALTGMLQTLQRQFELSGMLRSRGSQIS